MNGLIGIFALLGGAYFMSNNRKAINWRLVIAGLALQLFLAVFCLKVEIGQQIFLTIGHAIEKLLNFSDQGASFVFGFLVGQPDKINQIFGPGSSFIFAFKLVPTIIFVATLVGIAYHIGLMQRVVKIVATIVYKLMGASGAEALSNAASIFVGQIEAQLLIEPYVPTMTKSELLAVMAGSMACIAGGIMAVYIQMGVPASYLLTASLMAVPGALVISKIVYPETEESLTKGKIKINIEKHSVNVIHAAAMGASEGLKIGLNVCAMLIGFIALIGLVDFCVGKAGLLLAQVLISNHLPTQFGNTLVSIDLTHLSLATLLGSAFGLIAVLLGVPVQDANAVGAMMGTKMVVNEFVAYMSLAPRIAAHTLNPKSIAIASFALCGFANFSSVAMQIGGIGEMAPSRKKDLAQLGIRAMICGTMASYISAAWAGILLSQPETSTLPTILLVIAIAILVIVNVIAAQKENTSLDQVAQKIAASGIGGIGKTYLPDLSEVSAARDSIPATEGSATEAARIE